MRQSPRGLRLFSLNAAAWAGDRTQTTHGQSSIEFKGFAAPIIDASEESTRHRKHRRTHVAVEAGPERDPLWDFIVGKIKSGHMDPDPDRGASEYAAVGPDAYLAIMSTGYIYLAEPRRDVLQYLTSVRHAVELDPLSFRSLPKGWAWALVHASDLQHGRISEGFGALFVDLSGRSQPAATYLDLAGFSEDNDGEGPDLCADPSEVQDPLGYTPFTSSQHAESFSVEDVNHDGLDDVVIYVAEQNCSTRELRKLRYISMNTGHSFGAAKISNDRERE